MEDNNIGLGNTKSREIKVDENLRLTVSKGADASLCMIVDRVNEGFQGGKVNRSQMANWIFQRFSRSLSEAEIREIRADHFDEVAMLESILRRAKETGRVPEELKGILQKDLGFGDAPRKKSKKSLKDDIINGDIINDDI